MMITQPVTSLCSLNLHNFEDEVHNIVDKAIKEMAMERMLKGSWCSDEQLISGIIIQMFLHGDNSEQIKPPVDIELGSCLSL